MADTSHQQTKQMLLLNKDKCEVFSMEVFIKHFRKESPVSNKFPAFVVSVRTISREQQAAFSSSLTSKERKKQTGEGTAVCRGYNISDNRNELLS